nr:hypothetical protein CFP56_21560 [Quercus suber]
MGSWSILGGACVTIPGLNSVTSSITVPSDATQHVEAASPDGADSCQTAVCTIPSIRDEQGRQGCRQQVPNMPEVAAHNRERRGIGQVVRELGLGLSQSQNPRMTVAERGGDRGEVCRWWGWEGEPPQT